MEQIKNYNISDVEEVFYAGLNESGILYVSTKTKQWKRDNKFYNNLLSSHL